MPIDTSAIRRLAKSRGLTMKFVKPNYSLFEGEGLKFKGDEAGARKFLLGIPGKPRGRPQGYVPPRPGGVRGLGVELNDYNRARRHGDYSMKVADGVITLRLGDEKGELVFESSDVVRLRRFLKNAKEGLVPRGPRAIEREARSDARLIAGLIKSAERERRQQERRERLKAERAKRRGQGQLAKDDVGLDSEDFTPANYQGLVETEIELPEWLSADAALIALWRVDWKGDARPVIRAQMKAATRSLQGRTAVCMITLSDADRASLNRHRGSPSEVLTAAALAPRAGRARRGNPTR